MHKYLKTLNCCLTAYLIFKTFLAKKENGRNVSVVNQNFNLKGICFKYCLAKNTNTYYILLNVLEDNLKNKS